MARDGTARGSNIKVNAGRKSKALSEKIATGNPGGRKLKVIDLPDATELEGVDIPEPSSYIKAKQKAVGEYDAEHIYKYIYTWLKEKGCDKLISKHLVEQYAMSVSRLIQCEWTLMFLSQDLMKMRLQTSLPMQMTQVQRMMILTCQMLLSRQPL